MKIQIFSDVHIDHGHNPPAISHRIDAIIIAGDISNGGVRASDFFDYVRRNTNVPVISVLGNHDYYNRNRTFSDSVNFHKKIASNFSDIHVLDCETLELNDVNFIGATLWTDYDKGRDEVSSIVTMPCFKNIVKKEGSRKILVSSVDIVNEHKKHVSFIESGFRDDLKNVVITHHVPTFSFMSDKYRGSSINGAFCVDLDSLILSKSPDMWVFGHTHDRITGQIGNCDLYCNPYGYPFENETGYVENFTVEI